MKKRTEKNSKEANSKEAQEIIDRYSHLLKTNKRKNTSDQQKVNGLISRMSGVLSTSH
ncbi:hypothetical protein HWN40_09710 [Methanolobus zinderi]|jgi:ATP phosphoribosyltransferase|uniref:Uncharacterized protein n=1 Tax=Methanolobus zinderi TaxID=536044 RepID=A0A7D5IC89_9EURY|nr:hypothetical protein [Methanolobus zinderi]QLC50489.1 hypothetical protein HWN40_09710 [Methanolobus zinderi]